MAEQILVGLDSGASPSATNDNNLFGTETLCSVSGLATKLTYRNACIVRPGFGRAGMYTDNAGTLMAQTPTGAVDNTVDWVGEFETPVSVVATNTYFLCAVSDATGFTNNCMCAAFNGNGTIQDVTTHRKLSHTYTDPLPGTYTGSPDGNLYFAGYVSGYAPPTIVSIDGDNTIDATQTGVELVGTNLVDSGGAPTLELCNNSDYGAATIKVTQSINSSNDTGINFDVVQGGLSAGTVYAFVTTGLGQQNAAFAVTLVAGAATNSCTVEFDSAGSEWDSTATQENPATVSADSAGSEWEIITSFEANQCTVSFQSPGSEWDATAEQKNACTASFDSSGGEWTATADNQNPASVSGDSPGSDWDTTASQENPSTVEFDSAGSEWDATATQSNACIVESDSPGSNWSALATQENGAQVVFSSPGSEWLIVIDGVATNSCTVEFDSPGAQWDITTVQRNAASVSFVSPGSEFAISIDQRNNVNVAAQSAASLWDIASALRNAATVAANSPGSQWLAIIDEANVNLCTVAATSAASAWDATIEQNNTATLVFDSAGSEWLIVIPPTNIPTTGLIRISSGDRMVRIYSNEKESTEV